MASGAEDSCDRTCADANRQCESECLAKVDDENPIKGGKCQRVRTGEIRCMCHN
ncbi:unnamed protein product [Cylicocyclus nassatus]|uniref:Uncharacterized protein n=1 Tax=Cylicocyclus nassatus TaxID=53992 RepID=A0AA36GP94_CYLNA|nr:unnamed protein product [Cylicocyclus nassatus]